MRYFKTTQEIINSAVEELQKSLITFKTLPDKITLNLQQPKEEEALILLTQNAATKMKALINQAEKEIAWHGTVSRGTKKNIFLIEDIFVFPQIVTGASVDTDDEEYNDWLLKQPGEIYNKLRFHGHSHVNMGVTPSGTDDKYRYDMCQQLEDFYIFGIFNKKNAMHLDVYDVENNIYYENADVSVKHEEDKTEWAKEKITTLLRAPVTKVIDTKFTNPYLQNAANTKAEATKDLDALRNATNNRTISGYSRYTQY